MHGNRRGGLGTDDALIDATGHGVEEEVEKIRDHRFAALGLDDLDDLVVRSGVELDEDLPHDADARLAPVVHQGQHVEVMHDPTGICGETLLVVTGEASLAMLFPPCDERIGGAGLGLVGTRAVEALHEQVGDQRPVDRLVEHPEAWLIPGM